MFVLKCSNCCFVQFNASDAWDVSDRCHVSVVCDA
jgi:hypothetical protein